MTNPSKPVPPGTPRPSTPPPGPRHPAPTSPPGPRHNDIFDLAAALGFKDLGRCGPQGVRPLVADSEGRAGSTPPGAVPFTLPPTKAHRSFDGTLPTPNPPPPPPQPFPPAPFPRPGSS